MAIVKNISRVDDEFSSSGTPCSEDEGTSSSPSETADAGGATDSGMGPDAIDLSEMVETGAEFCQVENQSCNLPLDLYDLPDLREILSVGPLRWLVLCRRRRWHHRRVAVIRRDLPLHFQGSGDT